MATKSSGRLSYGPRKYAGLQLLLSRWLRLYGERGKQYCYVTLGGTELRDVQSLRFIDVSLTDTICSYETDGARYGLAKKTAADLAACGIAVDLQYATVFSHKRRSDSPHIFFVDLEGICAWGDYDQRFGEMFQNEVIREGDCLVITSHLGHNRGLDSIRQHFAGELAILGIDGNDNQLVRGMYRRSHPTMTLFKALCLNRLQSELQLRCFGTVKYQDTNRTPMGIYGYAISGGTTELTKLIGDSDTTYFDVNEWKLCGATDF